VNRIDLKVHQVTAFITFGLTKNIDMSIVIPYEEIRFGVSSSATIVPGTYYADDHYFAPGCGSSMLSTPPPFVPACFNHNFPDSSNMPSKNTASGIGDVTLRLKGTIWRGERAGVAAGVDVRFPSGDVLNYLGSGAYGIRPFAVASYRARISPHGMIGFEANGSSVTSGDVTTGVKGQVPNELTYDGGVDAYATKWLTGSFDIVGQRVFNTETVAVTSQKYLAPCPLTPPNFDSPPTTEPAACGVTINGNTTGQVCTTDSKNNTYCQAPGAVTPGPISAATLTTSTGKSFNITNASAGFKVAIFKRLVLTLNVLVRLDNGGLHSKPAPMGGLSYTF
jgi:hypothetical protein